VEARSDRIRGMRLNVCLTKSDMKWSLNEHLNEMEEEGNEEATIV